MKFKTVLVIELHLPDEEKEVVIQELKQYPHIGDESCNMVTQAMERAIRKHIIPRGVMTIKGKTKHYIED